MAIRMMQEMLITIVTLYCRLTPSGSSLADGEQEDKSVLE